MAERPRRAAGNAGHPGSRGGAWLLAALGLVLAAGLGFWFYANYERQLKEISVDASPAARRNPFLAAERFLTRVGIDARGAGGMELLRTPPDTRDMLVVDGLPALNAARSRNLRDWIEAGGQLLVEAVDEPAPDDEPRPEVFLDGFGVTLRYAADLAGADDAVAELRVEDYPQPVRVGFHPGWYLEDQDDTSVGGGLADGKARLLQYRIGDGTLYVVSDSRWLGNDGIGEHDNALLLALLATERGTVWLLHDVSTPGLAPLLWRSAPAAIVSAALLAGLLLWHLGARLGPLLPAPPAGRRDLLEHLQAAGDFLWHLRRGSLLVQQTRQRVERRWLKHHPPLKDLDQTARAGRIAELSGLAPADVGAALYGPIGHRDRLVDITATLQRLAQSRAPLARAPRSTGTSRQVGP